MRTRRPILITIILALVLTSCKSQGGIPVSTVTPVDWLQTATAEVVVTHPTIPASLAPTPTPTVLTHLQVTPTALDGVVLRFSHPYSGDTAARIEQLLTEFNQTNVWGVRVISTAAGSSGSLYSMVKASLGGDSIPNVIVAPQEFLRELSVVDNILIDLNDYIQDPQWGMNSDEVDQFLPEFWKQDTQGERQLGIPAVQNPRVLFYNLTWAQELGFEQAPATPKEFQAQACAAAKANLLNQDKKDDGTGGWIIDTDGLTMLGWLDAFGVELETDNDQAVANFNQAGTTKVLIFLREVLDQGCAWHSRVPQPYDYFSSRQALFYSGPLADIAVQESNNVRLKSNDQWTVIRFPAIDGIPRTVTSGLSYGILAASPVEQLAAWLLVRWLAVTKHEAQLVSASGAWPVTNTAIEELAAYSQENPQWGETLQWISNVSLIPTLPGWRQERIILEDAAWQLFQTNFTPDQIPQLVEMLNETIKEVTSKNP